MGIGDITAAIVETVTKLEELAQAAGNNTREAGTKIRDGLHNLADIPSTFDQLADGEVRSPAIATHRGARVEDKNSTQPPTDPAYPLLPDRPLSKEELAEYVLRKRLESPVVRKTTGDGTDPHGSGGQGTGGDANGESGDDDHSDRQPATR